MKSSIKRSVAKPADSSGGYQESYYFDVAGSNFPCTIYQCYFVLETDDPKPWPYTDLTILDVPLDTFTLSSSCPQLFLAPNSLSVTAADEQYWQNFYDAVGFPPPYSEVQTFWQISWMSGWFDVATTCTITASLGGSPVATMTVNEPQSHDPSKDPGDTTDPCDPCAAGSPISLQTGDVLITETDLKVPGLGGGLGLTRLWHSKWPAAEITSAAYVGAFGAGWRSTYEERVFTDNAVVEYLRHDGSLWEFSSVGGGVYQLTSPSNGGATLTSGPSNWTITFKNGEKRLFNQIGGSLIAIIDRNMNVTHLEYDGLNRLIRVTDPAARSLYFSYSGNEYLATSVTSDVGLVLTYSYDSYNRLVTVTKPDKSILRFEYASGGGSWFITAVKDSSGKILESHTYDQYGRGLSSSRADGVEGITMTYPATQ